jgi:hypothetical protein
VKTTIGQPVALVKGMPPEIRAGPKAVPRGGRNRPRERYSW